MSKSTGSKGSDNNSKGSNTSSSSGSDSESKGSSSTSKGGGNSGASQAAANKAASDAKAAADKANAKAKADADAAEAKAKADSDAKAAGEAKAKSQHQAAVDSEHGETKTAAETYGSFINGVLDAAPVGVDNINKGRFGTELSDAEVDNKVSEVQHGFAANEAWNDGRYGDWASNKIGGLVDSMQGWGLEQSRELTQAPLDKMADLSRDPVVKGLATLVGGPVGLAVTTGVGIVDSVADYAQGEKTAKQSAFQGIGDVVMGFGPPQARLAYSAVTNPRAAAKTVLGTMTGGITDPIASVAMNRMISFGVDNMADGMTGVGTGTELSNNAMGEGLLASRGKADQSYQSRVERTTGTYTKPVVTGNDAMLLPYQKYAQQEQNKPRYSSSMLFGIS